MQSLQRWLGLHADNQQDALCIAGLQGPLPTLTQITGWLGYIIDAHFAVLVLAKESHPLLDAINEVLQPRAVAVVIEAEHHCMSTRGVHKPGVSMVTSQLLGQFHTDPALKAEFMNFIRR